MKIKHKIIWMVISSILALGLWWGCWAFVSMQPNPFSWPQGGRCLFLILGSFWVFSGCMVVVYVEGTRG